MPGHIACGSPWYAEGGKNTVRKSMEVQECKQMHGKSNVAGRRMAKKHRPLFAGMSARA